MQTFPFELFHLRLYAPLFEVSPMKMISASSWVFQSHQTLFAQQLPSISYKKMKLCLRKRVFTSHFDYVILYSKIKKTLHRIVHLNLITCSQGKKRQQFSFVNALFHILFTKRRCIYAYSCAFFAQRHLDV